MEALHKTEQPRPTTKDLARVAGVSLATVDRVLNNRANVSERAKERVHQAIDETGFVRNSAAALLAKNRFYRLRFLLPDRGDEYLQQIREQIEETYRSFRHDFAVIDTASIPTRDPHAVVEYLSSLSPVEVDGLAIMGPESPQVRDALARLRERGVRTLPFLSGRRHSQGGFVGADSYAAGATAGRIMGSFLRDREGAILVVTETMRSLESTQRRQGFDAVLRHFPDLVALPSLETRAEPERAHLVVSEALGRRPGIIGAYILGSEARIPATAIARHVPLSKLTVVAHERTPFTEAALDSGEIDAIIAQDPGHAVRSAIRILRAQLDDTQLHAPQERIRNEVLFKENL